ncbi:MAG: membrane protein insertase YidC [bacterium]
MEKRTIIALSLYFVIMLVWWTWWGTKKQPQQIPEQKIITQQQIPQTENILKEESTSSSPQIEEKDIIVENNFYKIILSNKGAYIKQVFLKQYYEKENTNVKLIPLDTSQNFSSGIISCLENEKLSYVNTIYECSLEKNIILDNTNLSHQINFVTTLSNGLEITKTYSFENNSYLVDLEIKLKNIRNTPISFGEKGSYKLIWGPGIHIEENNKDSSMYTQIVLLENNKAKFDNFTKFTKQQKETEYFGNINWIGIKNKYFASILVPLNKTESAVVAPVSSLPTIGLKMPALYLKPQESQIDKFLIYQGPLKYDLLSQLKDKEKNPLHLEKIVYMGWDIFKGISVFMLNILNKLYDWVHNYGWAIILLTFLIKILLSPTTHWSMKSTKALQNIQPAINEIKAKYKNDQQKANKEIMELYRRYKVNPFGGCFPMLLQMPILVALFGTLSYSIELRQSSFFWIQDLAKPDTLFYLGSMSINILPILMTITTIIQTKMTPTMSADNQAKTMVYIMPLIMLFIFWNFPSGLVLYWLMMNIFTIIQQWMDLKLGKK